MSARRQLTSEWIDRGGLAALRVAHVNDEILDFFSAALRSSVKLSR
jgi:hypothetical protein